MKPANLSALLLALAMIAIGVYGIVRVMADLWSSLAIHIPI